MTFSWSHFWDLKRMVNEAVCWVADKTGKVHSGEGKLLLEIMRRFVALPWVRKLGSLAPWAWCGSQAAGFPRFGGAGRGGRCTVVVVCRWPSPFDLGPFEAGY